MRKLLVVLLIAITSSVFAQDPMENIKKFFSREGYVIKVEKGQVLIDMGRDQVKVGEEFSVFEEGKELFHPITGKPLGKERKKVGEIKIDQVEDNFSRAKVIKEEGRIKVGDKVVLSAKDVCYEGSEEGFFKISSVVEGIKKGSGCAYTVKEFKDGYGVEFLGSPVAFYSIPQVVKQQIERASLRDLRLLARSRLIKALPSIPISADVGDLMGNGKEYLAILYSGRVEVYELLKNDIIKRSTYSLPAGSAVNLVVARVGKEDKDYIIVNMISGDKASSLILKMVGDSLVPVKTDIPYIMGVLDKSKPKETFVGQSFDFDNKFGKVVRLSFEGDNLKEVGIYSVPRGFRIDSAFYYKNYLVFTDGSGRVRVFDGSNEVFSSDESFGGSYSYVEVAVGSAGKINYIFNPRGAVGDILGFKVAYVVKNSAGIVQRFLDIVKYSRGDIFILDEERKDIINFKQLVGGNLEEAIQSVIFTKDGRLLVLTGRTGTIPIQNKGELYEIEIRAL
ncbi:hypothetical protein [Hydrogenobacter hydrogenophilus]|uniref:Uncharacterized protein n=1 Tax=Hydrogenobacter hydrogenophilus TaxID=35835 RepID=A0A285NW66_9AQUI|nr:hypothetical protein [Hydrogenobacter hydrogenophilus]SNZ13732.1 hypothetical protein SAMN06265353_0875 [Hydrogenobacter hydrogenophilus]